MMKSLKNIINYRLRVHKIGKYDAILIPNDSTITDTSFTIYNLPNGKYSCEVYAKNEFGWSSPWETEYCDFTITTSEVHQDLSAGDINLSIVPKVIINNATLNFYFERNNKMRIKVISLNGNEVLIIP